MQADSDHLKSCFFQAIQEGDSVAALKLAQSLGVAPNDITDSSGEGPLFQAFQANLPLPTIGILMKELSLDPASFGSSGYNAFHWASAYGQVDYLLYLLKDQPELINCPTQTGALPIELARDHKALSMLLERSEGDPEKLKARSAKICVHILEQEYVDENQKVALLSRLLQKTNLRKSEIIFPLDPKRLLLADAKSKIWPKVLPEEDATAPFSPASSSKAAESPLPTTVPQTFAASTQGRLVRRTWSRLFERG